MFQILEESKLDKRELVISFRVNNKERTLLLDAARKGHTSLRSILVFLAEQYTKGTVQIVPQKEGE